MNKFMLKYYPLLILFTPLIMRTSEGPSKNYSITPAFQNYKAITTKKVLIVGCGHTPGYDGDHSHPHCWCVDIDRKDDTLPTPWWQRIEADAELDITDTNAAMPYKSQFDVVVLEGLWEEVLNNPHTLYNATLMLKINGELLIDTYEYFSYNFYKKYHKPTQQITDVSDNVRKKLEFYGCNMNFMPPYSYVKNLQGIACYLQKQRFADVIALSKAYQPYTATPGKGLKSARKTYLLSATKTRAVKYMMVFWYMDINQESKYNYSDSEDEFHLMY